MGKWTDRKWQWEVAWRRPLLERERILVEELMEFLNKQTLIEGAEDEWRWKVGPKKDFSVKLAYKGIMDSVAFESTNQLNGREMTKVWKTCAPLKAQVTAWRAGWNRLPTADNLVRVHDLPPEKRVCSCCNSCPETAAHLFLRCTDVARLW